MKNLIIKNFESFSRVFVFSTFAVGILMMRIKITGDTLFLFLVWNLFLAAIPFGISLFVATSKVLPKWKLLTGICCWLLFLPNAPYIITDFIHLTLGTQIIFWLDLLLITLFSISGLLLYGYSFIKMEQTLVNLNYLKIAKVLKYTVPFLSGFGIYLGRFQRWNSWDLLSNPLGLISDIFSLLFVSENAIWVWAFTIIFGLFLLLISTAFRTNHYKISEENSITNNGI